MKASILAALLALPLLAARAAAQRLEPRPVPTGRVEAYAFESKLMGVRYSINVGLPQGYDARGTRRYPLLVTTDGDQAFRTVYEAVSSLGGAIQPVVLVSIGTGEDEGLEAHYRRRIYEFSPSWERQDPFGQEVSRVCREIRSPEGRCVGGAARFLEVIVSELIPLVSAKYRIDTTMLGLFGHSAGGYFASWAMFQANSPFTRYLISSPTMAYGDGEIFREEERYAGAHQDLAAAVYFGAGLLEAADPFLEGVAGTVSGMSHLAGILAGRKYPSLTMTIELHPGMGHGDVVGTSVVRGMRVLYPR